MWDCGCDRPGVSAVNEAFAVVALQWSLMKPPPSSLHKRPYFSRAEYCVANGGKDDQHSNRNGVGESGGGGGGIVYSAAVPQQITHTHTVISHTYTHTGAPVAHI